MVTFGFSADVLDRLYYNGARTSQSAVFIIRRFAYLADHNRYQPRRVLETDNVHSVLATCVSFGFVYYKP